MSNEYSIIFDYDGSSVYAECLVFANSSRLTIAFDGETLAEIEWHPYDPELETEEGLKAAAIRHIREAQALASEDDDHY